MAEHQLARQPHRISLQSLQKWGSTRQPDQTCVYERIQSRDTKLTRILLTAHAVTTFCQVSQNRNSVFIVQAEAAGAAE